MELGLYDKILTQSIKDHLFKKNLSYIEESIDPEEVPEYLIYYLNEILAATLAQQKGSLDFTTTKQIEIINKIIALLKDYSQEDKSSHSLEKEITRLLEVIKPPSEVTRAHGSKRPTSPLTCGALLTGISSEPSLISELKKEIATSDKLDFLVSFIRWSGIRILLPALEEYLSQENKKLRIITTTYIGATEVKAIDALSKLPNTTIKISYDSRRSRLHAKAYIIYRNTGFSSAYIGSSNISRSALDHGLEWNVKISQYEQPYQWDRITGTFETLWNDSEFVKYSSNDREKLQRVLGSNLTSNNDNDTMTFFDLKPYPFQSEILDRIEAERDLLGTGRHLIVAATGTGKTMIAAFDFKSWQKAYFTKNNNYPSLLFIAHREEILKQSLQTFRAVLKDYNFGELLVGGLNPDNTKNLFISIQSLHSRDIDVTNYNYVIIDEFHHAEASTYKRILKSLNPDVLLGLTATPERGDGLNVASFFDNHISAEIRLPDAINRKLLVPFQYFGITDHDKIDYTTIRWSRGGYNQSDLSNLVTGNDMRAQLILDKLNEIIFDISQMRALGFCVSQDHAQYMADVFNKKKIAAAYLTADSSKEHRNSVQKKLVQRQINIIFVVDLYNEGVDIPEIDTILFLRPTESLTVFLQQLGRGLRINEDKECLTVLDFVGHAHKNFRFDLRIQALTGSKQNSPQTEVEQGFPHLPSGCSMNFEKIAMEHVLENIRNSILKNKPGIIQAINTFEKDTGNDLTFKNFIDHYQISEDYIYKKASWSRLCCEAGIIDKFNEPDEEQLAKGLRRLLHVDDIDFINTILTWLQNPESIEINNQRLQRKFLMLHFNLWGNTDKDAQSLEQSLNRLNSNPVIKRELVYLLQYLRNSIESKQHTLPGFEDIPLKIHARYTRDEILAATGAWTFEKVTSMREGTLFVKDINVDISFITLNKTEKEYSPTTMYNDYAINENLFHWQSQSTTSDTSPTAIRYIENKSTRFIFVRENKKKDGLSEPYYFLGTAKSIEHKGSKPVSFTLQLDTPIPAHLLRQTRRMMVG